MIGWIWVWHTIALTHVRRATLGADIGVGVESVEESDPRASVDRCACPAPECIGMRLHAFRFVTSFVAGTAQIIIASSAAAQSDWRFEVVDQSGNRTPARVATYDAAARKYLVPEGALSWVMSQQPGRYNGAEYFYTSGAFRLSTTATELDLYVRKGLEYAIVERTVTRGEEPTVIRMTRALDMNARGFYSGDGHIHPVGGKPDWLRLHGRRSFYEEEDITNELLRMIVEAEDLDYANLLSSNSQGDEVHMAHRVTGRDEPESDHDHILRTSEEYRSEVYGHMAVFGVIRPSDPVFTGLMGSLTRPFDYPTNHEACLRYQEQGAFPSFAHLRQQQSIALECPVDVALGSLSAIELQGYAVAPRAAALLWERLMSCGFDVVITAGTDCTLTSVMNLPAGGARVYVDLDERPFTHEAWLERLAEGRAFTTNGAMLLLTVDGRKPGESIEIGTTAPKEVEIEVLVDSLFPWDTVTLVMNSEDVLSFRSAEGHQQTQRFIGSITLSQPAWIYAHLEGGVAAEHVHAPMNPWWTPTHDAFTNAIWVRSGETPRRDAESAVFLIDWIRDNLRALELRSNYGSRANRRTVRETFMRALRVLEQRREEATVGGGASGSEGS